MTKKKKENSLSKVLGNTLSKDTPLAELNFDSMSPYSWYTLAHGVRVKGTVVNSVLLIYEIEMKSTNHFHSLLNRLEGFKFIMAMPIIKENMSTLASRGYNVIVFNDSEEEEVFIGVAPEDTFSQLDEDNGLIQYQLGVWET